ncbi:hypothetical protein FOPG_17202 [Fusarium oxysporum f. sp. conglutinans race 2 54008]|uniref:E3 SUMO-protein ligase pli1 n=2 Tax=Fusarium oxysporum TaxID=5507 RepID=X0GSN5_FUSOX|nr:hypothetical protein FOPG_17202 [Fusarium oxysporum f. sp. conglutinans race 2 54008]
MASWFLRLPVPANPSSGNGNLRTEGRNLMLQLKDLNNHQLSTICEVHNAESTGTNVELQHRIHCLIQDAVNASDRSGLQKIHQNVKKTKRNRQRGSSFPQSNFPESSDCSPGYNLLFRACHGVFPVDQHSGADCRTSQLKRLTFKPSPFYQQEVSISDGQICDATSGLHTISYPVRFEDSSSLQNCVGNPLQRVLIVCAGGCVGIQDVEFPQGSQLEINGQAFKADFLGLKNKPGSVRPIDITDILRLRPNYTNNVKFTYGPTKRVFYFRILVCMEVPVKDLVEEIHNRLPIDSAKQGLINAKIQDPDVIATSQVLSLRCPLSQMRLGLPCRGQSCTHLQCFDATSYLQLQAQGPQWECPICRKATPFEKLAVDLYMKDILHRTPISQDTITIRPNDELHLNSSNRDNIKPISHDRVTKPKAATPTNSMASHGESSPGLRGASINGKRRKDPVDLTLSDDEDARPLSKRRNTSGNL